MLLTDKVAMITGGGRGIGEASARRTPRATPSRRVEKMPSAATSSPAAASTSNRATLAAATLSALGYASAVTRRRVTLAGAARRERATV